MPSSPAHSAVRSLRTAYWRLWHGAAVSGGAALGLLPLIYVLPGWPRAALSMLLVLHLANTARRLRVGWKAVRQLRLEGCFIGHSFDGRQLRCCLQRRGHLWTHSYTVRALRRLMARPLSSLLVTGKKRRRVHAEYQRTLEAMRPARFSIGLPLGVLLTGGVLASLIDAAYLLPAAWPLRLGLASALVLLGAEGVQVLFRRRARRFFDNLTDALADWTLARSVYDLLHGRQPDSYRHTPLYRAPAWFAAPQQQAPARPPTPNDAADASSSSRRRAA